ncbi:MAG: RDD family protein, partial [Opitutus sp.]
TLPRAGLMIRLGALLLDVILVALVLGLMSSWFPRELRVHPGPGMLPILALYGALMWKLKGTTVGGIICGLKIVRLDDREVDWATAIVRALGCFLSLAVAGLGFIWIAIDEGRQSWHDKIAGTVVVRVPKGVSLI